MSNPMPQPPFAQNPTPGPIQPPPAAPVYPARRSFFSRIPKIHLLFAGLLLLFVALGKIPSMEAPKADLETVMRVPKNANDKQKEDIAAQNKLIAERNAEREEKIQDDLVEWRNGGERRHAILLLCAQYLAAVVLSCWLVFTVVTCVLRPLMRFIAAFLGEDFASVIAPLILLGLASVTAKTVLSVVPTLSDNMSGILPSLLSYIDLIIRPACNLITSFADLVLKNWVVGTAYIIIVVFAVIRKYFQPKF